MSEFIQNDLRVFVAPVDIFSTDLSSSEKLIYIALQSFANPHKQEAFPSYETIAKMCSLSRRRVIDLIAGLIEKGYITKETRFDVSKHRKIRNTSNLYTINSPSKVVKPFHHPSETISPPLVKPFHHPSETISPKQQQENKQIRKNNLNNNKRTATSSLTPTNVVVDSSDLEELLHSQNIKVNAKTLTKWRSIDTNENIIKAIQEALQKPNVKNLVGYITRMLESGYSPSIASDNTSNGKRLPEYVVNQLKDHHQESVEKVDIQQQKEVIELLFKLGEMGEMEYQEKLLGIALDLNKKK